MKRSQVGHVGGVLRRDDETELMTIVASALDKGAAVCLILDRRIGLPLLAVAGHAIAFEIAQMRVDRLARGAAHLRHMTSRVADSFTTRALTTTRRDRNRVPPPPSSVHVSRSFERPRRSAPRPAR